MKNYCHHNGKVTTIDRVKISPYDLGVLRGYGVFDVMTTENGKPFLFEEHWKRFVNSAKELHLKIPVSKEEHERILKKLIAFNKFKKSTMRTVLTGGFSDDGFSLCSNETFLVMIEKFHELPREVYEKGAKVITVDNKRDFPHAKITNYMVAIKNQEKKLKEKAFEIIYTKEGKALEASTSNLFIVKDGKIITPKGGILKGITRNLVLMLAKKSKLKVEERELKSEELFGADEVFLTATNKWIVPIVKIDKRKIGNGKVGEITKKLMKIIEDFAKKY